MDESDLNSLVSPCKRLKLLSPDKTTGQDKKEKLPDKNKDEKVAGENGEQTTGNKTAVDAEVNINVDQCATELSLDEMKYIDEEADVDDASNVKQKLTAPVTDAETIDNGISNDWNKLPTEAAQTELSNVEIPDIPTDKDSLCSRDRMFCVTGEPVSCTEEVPVATSDNSDKEIKNPDIDAETNVCQEHGHTGEVEVPQEGKTVHIVVLETDLDATLTNDNIERFEDNDHNLVNCDTENAGEDNESLHSFNEEEQEHLNLYPAYPLEPAVTILPVSIKKWLNDDVENREDHYPVMTTFKPQPEKTVPQLARPDIVDGGDSCSFSKNGNSSSSTNKGGNSIPLLTSTPIVKPSKGLQMRDMNIMRSESETEKPLKQSRNIEQLYEAENAQLHVYYGENERNIVNKKNAVNVEQTTRKTEAKETLKRDRESKREKKKIKGTRIQKFKEYIGPGLTSDLGNENEGSADPSKRDFVKNTDIQTCTLTEYKGFGLTGPLPDKPLKSSTPLPSLASSANLSVPKTDGVVPLMSSTMVGTVLPGQRPAGTEGMILANFGWKPPTPAEACTNTKDSSQPANNQSGSNVPFALKGSHSGQQQSLTDHSAQCHSGASSALQPDEVYPGHSSSHDNRSENNSNTDKSDHSEKFFDPKVLQCNGKWIE